MCKEGKGVWWPVAACWQGQEMAVWCVYRQNTVSKKDCVPSMENRRRRALGNHDNGHFSCNLCGKMAQIQNEDDGVGRLKTENGI